MCSASGCGLCLRGFICVVYHMPDRGRVECSGRVTLNPCLGLGASNIYVCSICSAACIMCHQLQLLRLFVFTGTSKWTCIHLWQVVSMGMPEDSYMLHK
jgi:hypothetical protein